jgi:beta-lactamase regulating signal transducer with metallopeptidase domain/predicted  nucleic acid-binding Zn-ribbon protein
MDTILPFVLGSIKALLLLLVASGAALVLHRRSARLRAVVWSIALAGCLAIPLVAPLLPTWSVPVPAGLARFTASDDPAQKPLPINLPEVISQHQSTSVNTSNIDLAFPVRPKTSFPWQTWALAIWALGAAALTTRLALGLWRVSAAVRHAQTVTDPRWIRHLDRALARLSCRRKVRLLVSDRIEIPATVGVFRPAILLPVRAATWFDDRRQAVLLHELVHVARFDWPARMIARLTRAAYWFNPLAWWAVRRLDLEQELACDEEVLALGTGASDYACHLLGIARHALPTPAPAIPALGMARTTHLEERIMTILKRSTHRRVGLAVIIPAAILMAAMVPALASVYPGDPTPRPASSELKDILAEMNEAEKKIEPHLKQIESIEVQMEPQLEALEDIEITIDETKLADIEVRMQPYLDRLEDIEIDMKPYEEQMEALSQQFENMDLHIEDGKLEDIERQIQEQMAAHMGQIESIQLDMNPLLEQMENIHLEMSGLFEEMADIHIDMEPIHAQMEKIHIDMEPFHEQLEQLHIELEPFHEEMEILGDRLEKAIQGEVVSYLRSELGAVTSPGAPFDEAAARIIDDADINVHDKVLKINGDDTQIREILNDLLLPHRIGTQESFDRAIANAANGLSPMVIQVD